jgi:hypothetical protein
VSERGREAVALNRLVYVAAEECDNAMLNGELQDADAWATVHRWLQYNFLSLAEAE